MAVVKKGQVWVRGWNGREVRVTVNRVWEDSVQVKTSDGRLRWMWLDTLTRLYSKVSDG